MAINIQDWVVELGVDTSKAEKKLKAFEGRMSKLAATEAKIHKTTSTALDKQNKQLSKQNSLEAQRLTLRKKIIQAEKTGIKDLKSARGALGGTNPIKIRSKVLELDKKITIERKKQEAITKAKPVMPKVKQAKPFGLSSDQRIGLGGRIDAQLRRAERGGVTGEAFNQLTRSAAELRTAMASVGSKDQLATLRVGIKRLAEDTTSATMQVRRLNAELNRQKFVAKATSDSVRNLARSYVSVFAAIEGGRSAFNVGRDFENMSSVMLLASGSSEQAASDMKFLIAMSNEMGVSLRDTSAAFAKFSVAAGSAGLDSNKTRQVFTDLTTSIRATGLSQDRANLAFLGFQQMLAGPVVQAQEMNQIIEQMPQFTGMAKKALAEMGMEVDNYREAVATGTVDSKVFVETVTRLMAEQAKQTGAYEKSLKSMTAAQGRFNTAVELTTNQFFEGGGKEGIVSLLDGLARIFKTLGPLFRAAGGWFREFGSIVKNQLDIYGGVVDVFTSIVGLINQIISLIPGLDKANKNAENSALGLLRIYQEMAAVVRRIQGILMMTVGIIQRMINLDFASFKRDFELLQKSSGPKSSGMFLNAVPFVGGILANANTAANTIRANSSKPTTVTNNPVININGAQNPDAIRREVQNVLQDTMRIGVD